MIFDFVQATKNASLNQSGRKFPNRDNNLCQDGLLFPEFKPSFKLEPGASIFTIGPCFARNIEEVLLPLGFKLPTASFSVPKSEWPARQINIKARRSVPYGKCLEISRDVWPSLF